MDFWVSFLDTNVNVALCPSCGSYIFLVGCFKAYVGESWFILQIFLNSIDAIVQLRPSMVHLDAEPQKRKHDAQNIEVRIRWLN